MHSPQLSPRILGSADCYRTLLEINNAIITNLTQDSLFNAICEALEHIVPVYRAAITLFEPEKGTLRIYALSAKWNMDFLRVGS
jgi:formate hydrogenlyase transcriptional activator